MKVGDKVRLPGVYAGTGMVERVMPLYVSVRWEETGRTEVLYFNKMLVPNAFNLVVVN